jgi:hypothetical protein
MAPEVRTQAGISRGGSRRLVYSGKRSQTYPEGADRVFGSADGSLELNPNIRPVLSTVPGSSSFPVLTGFLTIPRYLSPLHRGNSHRYSWPRQIRLFLLRFRDQFPVYLASVVVSLSCLGEFLCRNSPSFLRPALIDRRKAPLRAGP